MLIRLIIISFFSFLPFTNVEDNTLKTQLENLILPEGFKIQLYASDVENARSMAISPSGTIFVGNRRSDNVFALKDTDGDNIVDKEYLITDKLKKTVPIDYIRNNSLVPFDIDNGILKIAIPDASKLSLIKNLKTMTKLEPELYAAMITDISDFIERMSGGEGKPTWEREKKLEQY